MDYFLSGISNSHKHYTAGLEFPWRSPVIEMISYCSGDPNPPHFGQIRNFSLTGNKTESPSWFHSTPRYSNNTYPMWIHLSVIQELNLTHGFTFYISLDAVVETLQKLYMEANMDHRSTKFKVWVFSAVATNNLSISDLCWSLV